MALLSCATPAAAQSGASEEAQLYFKNGVELIQSQPPNYQDAYYQFKLAWEKSKSWKVLSNWGFCAMKLERDGEAIDAYTEYLKQQEIDPDERKQLERDLLLLNGNAATVTLTSNQPELEVIDARVGSAAPPQAYRLSSGKLVLRLRAGSHTLRAQASGRSLQWEVTLVPGTSQEHAFDFAAVETAASSGPATPGAPAAIQQWPAPPSAVPAAPAGASDAGQSRGGGLRIAGYVAAGVGLLALGGGAFVGMTAKRDEDRVRETCRSADGGKICPESARADLNAAAMKANVANALLIGGGVVAAAGVSFIVFGGPKRNESVSNARLQLTPLLGARTGGVIARGSF